MKTLVRNDMFDSSKNLVRGRGRLVEASWYIIKIVFFLSAFPWPSSSKRFILRRFNAKIGCGVVIKPRVNIHLPWKLVIGDYAWIGEEVNIINFESVMIGSHACISQRAFLCTGNHDFRDPTMPYRNAPITIGDGAWIGAQVFVAPGIRVGVDAVATAGSLVVKDLPERMVCSGSPCVPVKPRWRDENASAL